MKIYLILFFFPFLISFKCLSQSNLVDLFREIVPYPFETNLKRDYELDSIRYLSVMISHDSIFIFRNDFSENKTRLHIHPILNELSQSLSTNTFYSIVVSNQNNVFAKSAILENNYRSGEVLSVRTSGFTHHFTYLNEDISIVH